MECFICDKKGKNFKMVNGKSHCPKCQEEMEEIMDTSDLKDIVIRQGRKWVEKIIRDL